MDKIMEAVRELETKGSLQEQAEKLCNKERLYKKLIVEYSNQIQKCDDDELLYDLYLMRTKYKVRLENVKNEMCYLNKRFIDNMKTFDELMNCKAMNVEIFLDTFNLDIEEFAENEDCYTNLLRSSTFVGHVCRNGLIRNEEIVKELMEEDESTKEEDEIYNEMRDNY